MTDTTYTPGQGYPNRHARTPRDTLRIVVHTYNEVYTQEDR